MKDFVIGQLVVVNIMLAYCVPSIMWHLETLAAATQVAG